MFAVLGCFLETWSLLRGDVGEGKWGQTGGGGGLLLGGLEGGETAVGM